MALEDVAGDAQGSPDGAAGVETDGGRDRAQASSGLPLVIVNDRPLRDVTADSLAALVAANHPPHIFRRGTTLVRLRSGDTGAPLIDTLNDPGLRHRLARVADWARAGEKGLTMVPPPIDVVRDLYALPEWPLPVLNSIVESPIYAPDGTLISTPGYHPAARAWLHLRPGFVVPDVAASPSRDEVDRAKDLLLGDLLGDFPFTDEAGRAHALAALLLPFVRPMVSGPTPLHVIDKPTPGTGASLMIDVLAIASTGRTADVMTQSDYEEEWRKRITAILLQAPVFVLIDNLRRRLDSASVAAAITAAVWTDRLLGHSRTVSVPVSCCWCATGNNVALSNEIGRRTVLIRLDPKRDQPWLRTGFRHANLRRWATEHRGELTWAALTLAQAWIAAGQPEPSVTPLGNFEQWTTVIGGILEAAGVPGLLGNAREMYTNSDEEGRMWRQFISAWWQRFHAQSVQVADLYMLATEADMLAPVLGDKGERAQRTSLGRALMRMRDRVIGDHRIQVLEPDHRGVQRYRLETVGSGDPEPVTDLPPTHTEVNRQSAQRSADQNVSDATVSTATADLRRLLPVPGLREQPKDRQRTAVEAGVGSAWPTPPDSSEKSAEVGGGAALLEAHGVHAPDSAADVAASSAPTDEKSAEEGADLTEVTI